MNVDELSNFFVKQKMIKEIEDLKEGEVAWLLAMKKDKENVWFEAHSLVDDTPESIAHMSYILIEALGQVTGIEGEKIAKFVCEENKK